MLKRAFKVVKEPASEITSLKVLQSFPYSSNIFMFLVVETSKRNPFRPRHFPFYAVCSYPCSPKTRKRPRTKIVSPGQFLSMLHFLCICKGDNVKKILTKIFEKNLKHRQREEVPSPSTNLVQSDHQVHNQYKKLKLTMT